MSRGLEYGVDAVVCLARIAHQDRYESSYNVKDIDGPPSFKYHCIALLSAAFVLSNPEFPIFYQLVNYAYPRCQNGYL